MIYIRMWTGVKRRIHVQVPRFRRTEGYHLSATRSHLQILRNSSHTPKMSFSSLHQQRDGTSSSTTETRNEGVVERTIREKLLALLSPVTHLTVLNESHRHNVPVNSETHFKVVIVSPIFDTIPTLVGRHRLVNTVLADELSSSGPIHALSIVAKTPAQWLQQQQSNNLTIEPSPPCLGGDGSLPPKNNNQQ